MRVIMTTGAALSMNSLKKTFDGSVTSVDVTLEVREGEIISLVGPSGCGKTTTLRLIAGFEEPDSGELRIFSEEMYSLSRLVAPEKRGIGMVFQDYALFPHLSVLDNVRYGVRDSDESWLELLDLLGIRSISARSVENLSGGEQQRVAIARALAARPRILLLDEPFSNIDAAQRVHIRQEIIAALRTLETTVIWVTHDQEEALLVADRVAFMIDGEIKQIDSPEHIYMYPETLEAAEFIGEGVAFLSEIRNDQITSIFGDLPISECATESNRLEIDQSSSAILFVRPEQITLEPDQILVGSTVAGTVISKDYFGHSSLLTVQLDDKSLFKVRVTSRVEVSEGQRLNLGLREYPRAFAQTASV